MISTVLTVISLLIAGACAFWAWRSDRNARRCFVYVAESNKRSVTLRKLSEIEATLLDHADAVSALQDGIRKVRGRMTARANNAKRAQANGATDELDDEEWKRRTTLAMAKKQAE